MEQLSLAKHCSGQRRSEMPARLEMGLRAYHHIGCCRSASQRPVGEAAAALLRQSVVGVRPPVNRSHFPSPPRRVLLIRRGKSKADGTRRLAGGRFPPELSLDSANLIRRGRAWDSSTTIISARYERDRQRIGARGSVGEGPEKEAGKELRENSYSRSGTRSSAASQAAASLSDGARQSPRGESDPPEPTLGELGTALRLNWLV
jgi:hypothetical protein